MVSIKQLRTILLYELNLGYSAVVTAHDIHFTWGDAIANEWTIQSCSKNFILEIKNLKNQPRGRPPILVVKTAFER